MAQPGAADGIARLAVGAQNERFRQPVARVTDTLRQPRSRHVRWIGPFVASAQLAVVGQHVAVRPHLGRVIGERHVPRHQLVAHLLARRVARVVLAARLDVPLELQGWQHERHTCRANRRHALLRLDAG
eukprot:2905913-Prymnesium_polylepis.1